MLPYVPGFTPEDKDGNPLKPVDPKDPSKGYVVPNIPTDPSEDTPINYVANPKPQPKQEQPKDTPKEAPEKGPKATPVQPKAILKLRD